MSPMEITLLLLLFAAVMFVWEKIPLALTSNNWSVRRLGPRWRQLHKLTYMAVLLGAVHFVMLRKGFQIEPLLYLGAILILLALRLPFGAIANRLSRA